MTGKMYGVVHTTIGETETNFLGWLSEKLHLPLSPYTTFKFLFL